MAASKLALLESRVTTLEAEIARLKHEQITATPNALPWWEQRWGLFDNDPDYEKAMELGRQYRESLRPKSVKIKARKKAVKQKSTKNGKSEMHILDTDLFSLTDRTASHESQRLRFQLSTLPEDKLATTIITFEEQMRGWLSWLAQARSLEQQVERYRKLNRMVRSYRRVNILEFDNRAVAEFERLQKLRIRIGTMDLKIAAIALANDATLLSRNIKDFSKVPSLKVEDWSA